MTHLLSARGIEKTFGGTAALRGLDLEVRGGEIHGLLGGNGAGKSTFIKILAGIHTADVGTINISGHPLDEITRHRIGFIHQSLGLVDELTVAENFGVVAGFPKRWLLVDDRRLRMVTRDSLDRVGLDVDPDTRVSRLQSSERSLVAIARALHREADLLVLDEPTASLTTAESERLFHVLSDMRVHGVGILYVSHRLPEVLNLCDRVSVMRDGRLVGRSETAALDVDALLALMFPGDDRRAIDSASAAAADTTAGAPSVKSQLAGHYGAKPQVEANLTTAGLTDAELTIRSGEVVACVGLRGAGHADVAAALFGQIPFTGTLRLGGRTYEPAGPADALRRGVALVSGERKRTVAPTLSVVENLLLNPPLTRVPGMWRSRRRERRETTNIIATYGLKPAAPDYKVGELSGGNAQKVVLARAMQANPKLLVLDEPTAGVDAASRHALYVRMRRQVAEGQSVLLVSSDPEEVEMLADRAYVFLSGRIVAHVAGAQITQERMNRLSMGGAA